MTTRREAIEWFAMAVDKGYRDAQWGEPPMRCKKLAMWIIGPVYWQPDARALRSAYMVGRSIGEEDAINAEDRLTSEGYENDLR